MDFTSLENSSFKVEKRAFLPRTLTCTHCDMKMKPSKMEVKLENDVFIKLGGFECPRCKKRNIGLEEARKLDRAMVISRVMSKDFKMRRNLSFDGDNYTFRIPKEFIHDVHKRTIEIVPLGAKEFCAIVE